MFNPFKRFGRKPETVAAIPKEEVQGRIPRGSSDPLDIRDSWEGDPVMHPIEFVQASDFPKAESNIGKRVMVGDSMTYQPNPNDGPVSTKAELSQYQVPSMLQAWYASQSFIGYQSCAVIAQQWLVDKACSQAGKDAVRHGWEVKAVADGTQISPKDIARLRKGDVPFAVKANLAELDHWKNIFGIRIVIFEVDSDDPDYYEKPFNIDGVTQGSYRGMSQVDPYWMVPMLSNENTSNPASRHFYEPDFWIINGRRYHRTHLIIARGPAPADILKPTYIFGGIPLTQMIYERVYAAERTANEAPLLALSKRTSVMHMDTKKAATQEKPLKERILQWVKYRDNYGVKILGTDETMEQFDTALNDFDSIIMNQYQLVAAIAKVPATKILGTSPKGFNSTGEFEANSYHEELESIQEHVMHPAITRHYLLLAKSLGIAAEVEVVFNKTDTVGTKELAELNDKKADTDTKNINMGVVSPEEVRNRLREDKHSGYSHLSDDEVETEAGMSPENLAALQKAGAAENTGMGALARGNAAAENGGVEPVRSAASAPNGVPGHEEEDDGEELYTSLFDPAPGVSQQEPKPDANSVLSELATALTSLLGALSERSSENARVQRKGDQVSRSVEGIAAVGEGDKDGV